MQEMQTRVHAHEGKLTFESVQDCTPILEHATQMHNAGAIGGAEMRHAARIPQVVVERYCHQNNILFSEFMANKDHVNRMLNDPSLAGFRIWKGKV